MCPVRGIAELASVCLLLLTLFLRWRGAIGHDGLATQRFENDGPAEHAAQAIHDGLVRTVAIVDLPVIVAPVY